MLNNLDAFLDLAARKQGGRLAVAACHDKDVLLACIEAEKRGAEVQCELPACPAFYID